MTLQRRRAVKRRAMLLLAATLTVVGVFLAGYAVANRGGSGTPTSAKLTLEGTKAAPKAQGTLEVWQSQAGNWPMTLTTVGLPQLPEHSYYEVYLVRGGKPWGACGAFRVGENPQQPVTVTLTAPYTLQKGDSWVVTRPGHGGAEPGQTVLKPAPVTT
jgi:N-acetylmuramoyl-L-alanine amidase